MATYRVTMSIETDLGAQGVFEAIEAWAEKSSPLIDVEDIGVEATS